MTTNEGTPGGNRGLETQNTEQENQIMTIIPPSPRKREHQVVVPLPFASQPSWAAETAEWELTGGGFEFAHYSPRVAPRGVDSVRIQLEQLVTVTRDALTRHPTIVSVIVADEHELRLDVDGARGLARALVMAAAQLEKIQGEAIVSDQLSGLVKAADALRVAEGGAA